MTRLPVEGSDNGVWGTVLNDFLRVSHNSDGTLVSGAITAGQIQPSTITPEKLSISGTAAAGSVLTYNGTGFAWVAGRSSDPAVGGDLSGTASNAQITAGAVTATEIADGTITNIKVSASAAIDQSKINNLTTDLSNKQPIDTDLTTIAGLSPADNDLLQRKSGAWTNRTPAQLKSDLSLTSTDVGLGNVDNTSDLNKPVSTATQNALNTKLTAASNLSDLTNAATARTNLSLGNVDNTSDLNKPVSTATQNALNAKLTAASNLSDLTDATTARSNLGLGGAATLSVGTTAGTVAAGDDARFSAISSGSIHAFLLMGA